MEGFGGRDAANVGLDFIAFPTVSKRVSTPSSISLLHRGRSGMITYLGPYGDLYVWYKGSFTRPIRSKRPFCQTPLVSAGSHVRQMGS